MLLLIFISGLDSSGYYSYKDTLKVRDNNDLEWTGLAEVTVKVRNL